MTALNVNESVAAKPNNSIGETYARKVLAFKKRYFAEKWEETCKLAGIEELHFHDIRGTTVTLLAESGCTLPEIVSITGHSLRTAQTIIEKYLARTSKLAASAIAKFENVLETDFAKRPAKRKV
jgi:integrase